MSNTSNKKSVPNLSKSQSETLNSLTTTAAKIRYLLSEGYSRGDTSRILQIRYQWVRNVDLTPIKTK